jgi:two-component system, NtrC family, nitrogen regulation sensor histidine kinase NtrY
LKKILQNKYFHLLLALVLFGAAYLLERPASRQDRRLAMQLEKTLHRKEATARQELEFLAQQAEKADYSTLFLQSASHFNELFEKEGLIFLIYENDTLKFWTNNSIAVENYMKEVCLDNRLAHLKNGWFEVMKTPSKPTGIRTIVGLILIKKEYPYQNQYLVNEFQEDFRLPGEVAVLETPAKGAEDILTSDGEYLCSIDTGAQAPDLPLRDISAALLCIAAIIFLVAYLRAECDGFASFTGTNVSVLIFAGSILLLRYVSIKTLFPAPLYDLELFSPEYYGDATSFWLPSLGDFLINIALGFYVAYYAYGRISPGKKLFTARPAVKIVLSVALLGLLLWLSAVVNDLVIGLIRNSNISFSINNLFSLNQYSYLGLAIVGMLLCAFFLLADKAITVILQLSLSVKQLLAVFITAALLHTLINHLYGIVDLAMVFWPLVIFLAILKVRQVTRPYPFLSIILVVFVCSAYSGHVFLRFSDIKEESNRKVFAEKLSAEKDPLAEHLFAEIGDKISTDTTLSLFLEPVSYDPDEFAKRLVQQYFSGYWEKYDVKIALFDTMCTPVLKAVQPGHDNITYFDEIIITQGEETLSENLFFINNSSGKISYLARVPIFKKGDAASKCATAYIELDSKFVSEEIGFPELLLDREIGINRQLANYSYAKYRNGELLNQFGKYQYSLSSAPFGNFEGKYAFIDMEGFNHLLYRSGENLLVVLSKKNEGWIGQTTTFSYLFAFFSLLLLILLMIRQAGTGRLRFSNLSFKYRIQLLLVVIVLVSLALFGAGTIFYIKQQYENQNKENISEKIHSVLLEVENKLGEEQQLSAGYRDYASYILKKFANVFFTDINLYDLDGNLLASSRPKLFDSGLTSRKMNPRAYLEVAINGRTEFIHDENIGRLDYLSAYVPFKNKEGKTLAYLNLPYFAKQSELEREISTFLVALINIYVLLFALSIIVAILISNYVTQPLKLIQDKLSKIKLGKTNELIEWKEKDEIGSLVSEYNRMIVELQKSAELLAKSERESAWREMAKQVAHEIKNPLTPMKLSIQHLQRTMNGNTPDLRGKVEHLTEMLIEQIDTLSSIANEFSAFAKMPKAVSEKLNLHTIIQNTIDLFRNSTDVQFIFDCPAGEEAFIYADKDQMLRVFNNLFKNAIQAIPEEQQGKVEVKLSKQGDNFLVKVKDNGTGISEEQIDKIFVPNFTTKTGGMGLGLAMVKNIIENFSGRIWFETAKGSGTTFFVSLPEYKDQ